MKKNLVTLLLVVPFAVMAQKTTIQFDTQRIVGDIDPNIYGVFMEPISFSGREGIPDMNTLYGTLYDPTSSLANKDGFRTDYIDAMKELKIQNMRWPGGNYVAGYNWQDGIGPKEQRPTRLDLAWKGLDPNQVGTDEWVKLNKAIGSANVVCVNLGLGDISNARYWVEYCNYPKGTYYSDLRAKYGNPEPYKVKIWDLGNEVDGEPWIMGHHDADEYVKIATEAAKAFKSVDDDIKLVVCGPSYYEPTGKWIDWTRKVVNNLTGVADYLSMHRYWEGMDTTYASYMGDGLIDFNGKIEAVAAQIEVAKNLHPKKTPLMISVDEWGAFPRGYRDVLANAMAFNAFIRHADVVKMANFTMMTSLLSSDPQKGTYKTPLFYTFKLFTNNCLGQSVDTYVKCDTYDTEANKNIPYIDATTVYSEKEKCVYINVVNYNQTKDYSATIRSVSGAYAGQANISTVNASLSEKFVYGKNYEPDVKKIDVKGNLFTYTFPAHSFTQIAISIKSEKE